MLHNQRHLFTSNGIALTSYGICSVFKGERHCSHDLRHSTSRTGIVLHLHLHLHLHSANGTQFILIPPHDTQHNTTHTET